MLYEEKWKYFRPARKYFHASPEGEVLPANVEVLPVTGNRWGATEKRGVFGIGFSDLNRLINSPQGADFSTSGRNRIFRTPSLLPEEPVSVLIKIVFFQISALW